MDEKTKKTAKTRWYVNHMQIHKKNPSVQFTVPAPSVRYYFPKFSEHACSHHMPNFPEKPRGAQ